MTTGAEPALTPTGPDAVPSDLIEIWRAIGRLEGTANALLGGQRELKEGQEQLKAAIQTGQQEQRAESRADVRELNRRIDRMFYAMLGIGGALLVSVYASQFIGL